MAGYSTCCKCFANASGTSNSEFTAQCCCKKYNIPHCYEPYDFICERNYTILRKICNKIFKDFIRSKHEEKYTIFDGGNSINVRIHRSGSRDDENVHKHKSAAQNDEKQKYGKRSEKNVGYKLHEYHYDENDMTKTSKRNQKKSGKRTDNKSIQYDTESVSNTKGKTKSNQRGERDDYTETRVKSRKSSERYKNDSDENLSSSAKKGNGNSGRHASNKAEMQKNIVKQIELKNDQDKKIKSRKSRKNYKTEYGYDFNERKYGRRGRHTSLRKDKKGSLDIKAIKDNRVVQEEHLKNKNLPVISNLRNKVRNGQNIVFDSEYIKSKNFMNHNEIIKPSRVDEAKCCDLLRAQMEQRDLCKLCCHVKPTPCVTYTCSSKMCSPNFRPKSILSCFSEKYKY